MRAHSSGSPTSAATNVPPIAVASCSPAPDARCRSTMVTDAPLAASKRAVSAPIPDAPPVTSAFFPCIAFISPWEVTSPNLGRPSKGRTPMRGVLYDGEQLMVTDRLEVTDPGHDQVVVRIGAAGVCHSDISMINGTVGTMIPPPFVLGHEGAGVVEAVGSQVTT